MNAPGRSDRNSHAKARTSVSTVLIGIVVCGALMTPISSAAGSKDKTSFAITDLFSTEEKKRAGLAKLSEEELRALNAAALNAFVKINAHNASTDDLDLYDASGRAVAYIAHEEFDKDLTIYLWSGKPCTYLEDEDIYGFNGKHLGWFKSGLVYDHDGRIVVALAEAFRTPVEAPQPKSFKQLHPFKSFKEFKPLLPLFSRDWSRSTPKVFLLRGAN